MADVTSTFAAKDVGFTSTVNRMQRSLANFQSGIAGFGMKVAGLAATFIGVQQSIAAFRNGLDMAGRLNDLSKTTGETAGNLAMLERAFQNNGMSAEQVGVSIAKMSEFIVNLQSGSESATKAANAMGISMADLANKSPVERMEVLMRAIAGIADPALRTATAVDVFGRSGRAVIPLASEFSGEIANARAELGSLVPILDANSASLDELGDKLQNSVGNKFNELAVGFAAGITGANDFVTALSRIDAAGFGKGLGDSLRVAFDTPKEAAAAVGHTLLTGVKEAGNWLLAAINKAGDTYYAMLQNPGFYAGLQRFLEGMFAQVGEVFVSSIINGIKAAFGLMDWNPLWKPLLDVAKGQMTKIQEDIKIAGEAAANTMEHGATQMKAAFNNAARDSQLIYKDIFGAREEAEKAANSWMQAQESSRQIREDSAETAANYGEGSAAIRNALNDIRGFDLKGQMGPEARPDWIKSNQPPPTSSSQRIAAEEANARALHAPRGGSAPLTDNMKTAELRAESRANRLRQRGNELADRGMFRSAVGAFNRADKASEKIKNNAQLRDMASQFDFAGRQAGNVGEAMKSVVDEIGKIGFLDTLRNTKGFDPNKSEMENFKTAMKGGVFDQQRDFQRDAAGNMSRIAEEQGKTPEERAAEEEAMRQKHAPPPGSGDSGNGALTGIVQSIKGILEELNKKLPQSALA